MTVTAVRHIAYDDAPEMTAILLCCMLFKLGGQITFTMGELQEIHAQFPSIRFALSQLHGEAKDEQLTCTLRSRDIENDRPYQSNGGRNG